MNSISFHCHFEWEKNSCLYARMVQLLSVRSSIPVFHIRYFTTRCEHCSPNSNIYQLHRSNLLKWFNSMAMVMLLYSMPSKPIFFPWWKFKSPMQILFCWNHVIQFRAWPNQVLETICSTSNQTKNQDRIPAVLFALKGLSEIKEKVYKLTVANEFVAWKREQKNWCSLYNTASAVTTDQG